MSQKQLEIQQTQAVTVPTVHPVFEKFMFIIAVVIPLMTLPQIISIWGTRSAANVSLSTWLAYLFSATCWLIHSILTRNKTLAVNQILWVALESIVVVGILIYR